MKTLNLNGVALAAAAAGLLTTLAVNSAFAEDAAATDKATVKCENSSACKGHGACKTTNNACKGHNSCKGQGMTMQESEDACKAAQAAVKQS